MNTEFNITSLFRKTVETIGYDEALVLFDKNGLNDDGWIGPEKLAIAFQAFAEAMETAKRRMRKPVYNQGEVDELSAQILREG